MLEFLFIEDNEDDYELAYHELRECGFQFLPTRVTERIEFQDHLNTADVIFADCSLPSFDCTSALSIWKSKGLEEVPFIILSGTISTEEAIMYQDLGATDVVLKENLARLGLVTKRALNDVKVKNQVKLSQMDDSVVHSINNSLTIITGNIDYCLFTIGTKDEDDIQNSLKAAKTACLQIARVLKNLGPYL